jgi:hypothetical protein
MSLFCPNPSCPAATGKVFRNLSIHFAKSKVCCVYFDQLQKNKSVVQPQVTEPLDHSHEDNDPFFEPTDTSEPVSLYPEQQVMEDGPFLASTNNSNQGVDQPILAQPAPQTKKRPPKIYDPAQVDNHVSFRQWVRDWI